MRQGRRSNAENATRVRDAVRRKAPKDRVWDGLSAGERGGSEDLHANRSSEAGAPVAISSDQGIVLGLEESAELAARRKRVLGRVLTSKDTIVDADDDCQAGDNNVGTTSASGSSGQQGDSSSSGSRSVQYFRRLKERIISAWTAIQRECVKRVGKSANPFMNRSTRKALFLET